MAAAAGAGGGFLAGRLTAPGPPIDTDHAAEIDVTIVCQTVTSPCNVTFLVDGNAKWTLLGGCQTAPCSLQPIPTAHRWTGPECNSFLVEARSALTDNETVALCEGNAIAVSLLAAGPAGPRSMGVSISRSADGTNWTLVMATVPAGLTTSDTVLAIYDTGGATAMPAEAFATLSYSQDGVFYGTNDSDGILDVAEYLLLSTSRYPTGYRVTIADSQGLLFAGTLM